MRAGRRSAPLRARRSSAPGAVRARKGLDAASRSGAPASLEEVYNRPGFLVKRCQQVAAALFDEECRGFNVTPSQYQALTALNEFPDIDQLALGRLTGQDRSTVSLVVRILIERGLVRQRANADDKRRKRLALTAAGLALLGDIAPVARRAQERFLAVLPAPRRTELVALLQSLVTGHGARIEPVAVLAGKRARARTSSHRGTSLASAVTRGSMAGRAARP